MTNPSRPILQATRRGWLPRAVPGSLALAFTILAMAAPMAMLAGCEKKKPPVVEEAPPPPPPPIPDPVQVDPIMRAAAPSAKVQFPQSAAPHSEGLARAVISFADALAKGDAAKFGSMLGPSAKDLLSQLENDGSWETSTASLEAVRVVMVSDDTNPDALAAAVYFAVQGPEGAYVMGWGAAKIGDQWTFTGAPASGDTRRRASEWDNANILALMNDSAPGATDMPEIPDAPADAPAGAPPAEPPPTGG
jgi:hypothetical protein